MKYCLSLLILYVKFSYVYALPLKPIIDVTLHGYNHKDSITNCSSGLLVGDTLVLNMTIKLHSSINSSDLAVTLQRIVTESHTPYLTEFLSVFIKDCYLSRDFSCVLTDKHELLISIKKQVVLAMSEMKLQVSVHLNEQMFESKIVKIPRVYDPSAIGLILNNVIVNDSEVTLVLQDLKICCNDAPTPCEVTIQRTGVTIAKQEQCVRYTLPESAKYIFGYKVCGIDLYSTWHTLHYKASEDSGNSNYLLLSLLSLLIVPMIGYIIYYYCKKENNKKGLPLKPNRHYPNVKRRKQKRKLKRTFISTWPPSKQTAQPKSESLAKNQDEHQNHTKCQSDSIVLRDHNENQCLTEYIPYPNLSRRRIIKDKKHKQAM